VLILTSSNQSNNYSLESVVSIMTKLIKDFSNFKKRLNLKDKTIKEYTDSIELFINWYKSNHNITLTINNANELTAKIAQQWIFSLRETLSVASTRKHVAAMNQLFNYLVVAQEVDNNIFRGLQIPKDVIKLEKDLMVQEQGDKLFESCTLNKKKLMMGNMLYLGMRIGEVNKIEVSNIDLEKKTVTILRKNSKMQTLPIVDILLPLYEEVVANCKYNKQKYLFTSKGTSKCITTASIRKTFDKLVSNLGYSSNYTPHQLRKLFATDMYYNKKFLLDEVREMLNHSSMVVTERYLIGTKQSRTFERLASL